MKFVSTSTLAKEKKLQATKHFTPGTTEWDIDQQQNIFNMIPTHKIGVKLNESFMMSKFNFIILDDPSTLA